MYFSHPNDIDMMTEVDYQNLLKKVVENDRPRWIMENLSEAYSKHKDEKIRFWTRVARVAERHGEVRDHIDYMYDLNSVLEQDSRLHNKLAKYLFIYHHSHLIIEKYIQDKADIRENCTINDLSYLMQFLERRLKYIKVPIVLGDIRYELSKGVIKVVTESIFQFLYSMNVFWNKELVNIKQGNISAYVRLYFSVPSPLRTNVHEKNIVLKDYRNVSEPKMFLLIDEQTKKENYSTVFRRQFDEFKSQHEITVTNFKHLERSRWQNIRNTFYKGTKEYNLIQGYLKILPSLSTGKVKSRISFNVDYKHKDDIQLKIQQLEDSKRFFILDEEISPSYFADVITTNDFKKYRKQQVKFRCESRYAVWLLNSIFKVYTGSELDPSTIERSGLFQIIDRRRKRFNSHSEKDGSTAFIKLKRAVCDKYLKEDDSSTVPPKHLAFHKLVKSIFS